MKTRQILCVFLSVCMMGIFSGCFNKTSDVINKTTDVISDAGDTEHESVFEFVDVMIGNDCIYDWQDNNVVTCVTWQKLKLSDECSKLYPSLSSAFDKYNKKITTDAKAVMYELTQLAKEMEGGKEEYNPEYCQADEKIYMQRADNSIISFLETVERYTGGVHPAYVVNGINFNPDTGERAALSDVLTDLKDLPSVLSKKITEKYPDVTFFDLDDTLSQYTEDDFTWTIDYQGITFWFSPYEIASFADGTLSAKIWFDEFPDLVNAAYKEAPEKYIMELPVDHAVDFDLAENDGVKDSICIRNVFDQDGAYMMLSVEVNGKTDNDNFDDIFDSDVYLAHIGDKNYIYSDSSSDNDYHIFCTWDINAKTPKLVDELGATEVVYEYLSEESEVETAYKTACNDPENLMLETRFQILGTRDAAAHYKLSEKNGKLVMTDDLYTYNDGPELKTIIELDAELLPKKEKTKLPVGTELMPYQTDGKTFVDFKTEKGDTVRLYVDVSDWPRTVNGISEEECFENILYAG